MTEQDLSRRNFLRAGAALIAASTIDASTSGYARKGVEPTPKTPAEPKIYTGFALEPLSPASIRHHEKVTGLQFPIVMTYQAWANGDIDRAGLKQLARQDKTPLITWEPWDSRIKQGEKQPNYQLSKITDGDHDAYIRRNALLLKRHEKPVFLRFAHEMNGGWFPWGGTANGNQPEDYPKAWNHVQDIFHDAGVDNVTWVWAPDARELTSERDFGKYFPGNERIDWAGFSGFNWGKSKPGKSWVPLRDITQSVYTDFTEITDKPIMIAETGSTEEGGDKAQWMQEGLQALPDFKQLRALMLYNIDKKGHADWRVESSRKSLKAFKKATEHEIYNAKTVKTKNGKIIPA